MTHLAGVLHAHTHTNVCMYTPLFTETQSDICGKITQQMILLTDLHALYELRAKMQIRLNPKPLNIISSLLFSMKFHFGWHLRSNATQAFLSLFVMTSNQLVMFCLLSVHESLK